MKAAVIPIVCLLTSACAFTQRPDYEQVTNFAPDCANQDAQIRYLKKLRNTAQFVDVDQSRYGQTIDIQIQRLNHYCSIK